MGEIIIMLAIWSGILGYPILQFIAIRRMHGVWRILATLPLLVMAVVFIVTLNALYHESNVWPIILIFVSPLIVIYLVVLFGVRHLMT